MRALALVVGNSDYPLDKYKLDNATNDASDFAEKLETLQFKVIKALDCEAPDFDIALASFEKELKQYDIGLFYYSGHALQINGRNYLSALDTGFDSEIAAKRTSIGLNDVIEHMENAAPTIKIIILDACRNNPYTNQYRGSFSASHLLVLLFSTNTTLSLLITLLAILISIFCKYINV